MRRTLAHGEKRFETFHLSIGHDLAASNSSTTIPEGSSKRYCRLPGPVATSARNPAPVRIACLSSRQDHRFRTGTRSSRPALVMRKNGYCYVASEAKRASSMFNPTLHLTQVQLDSSESSPNSNDQFSNNLACDKISTGERFTVSEFFLTGYCPSYTDKLT